MGHITGTEAGTRRFRRRPSALLAAAAVVGLLLSVVAAPAAVSQNPPPAEQGVGLAITPIFPAFVTVGAQDVVARLRIANNSEGVGPVTLGEIALNPACGDPTPFTACSMPDPGVFELSDTAIGTEGACTGVTFVVAGPDLTGRYVFVPSQPVVLQPPGDPDSTCVISFTFDVLRAPTIDASAPLPGPQTRQFATVTGTAPAVVGGQPTTLFGTGTGTSITTVLQAQPTIVTVATPTATLGQPISDTATVTGPAGGPTPTGTVTFTIFGPDDPTCAGAPVFTSTVPLAPNGATLANDARANSGPFTPAQPGAFNFVAVYSGDANFLPVTSPCGAPNETSQVNRPVATITTVATPSTTIGGTITDRAQVTGPQGSPAPTGTVTFTIFGPNNPTCTGAPVFTSANRPLSGGFATSEPFTPPSTGTYNFVAMFNGDAIFAPAISPCGAPNEQSNVLVAQPALTTEAQPTADVGEPITDTATLSGGFNPTGTITFDLFGPDDATCAGPPVFTSVVPVNGNGSYVSGPFTPTQPGTYRWVARYSGDANNAPAANACGDPNEITEVFGPPTIMVVKTVDPSTRPEPGGDFTYTVVVTNTGPNSLTITSLNDSVYGNLLTRPGSNCSALAGRVLAADPDGAGPGTGGTATCTFTAEFIGNADDTETDVVTVVGVDERGQEATDDDDATINIINDVPEIQVDKTVTPGSLPEPGGTFTYTVVVTNTGDETLTITSLTDDVYGNIATQGTCTTAIGQVLESGESYTCTFPGVFIGEGGDRETDTVTVIGVDDEGTQVTDEDDATVTLTEVLAGAQPTVRVVKTATPLTRVVPGGTFTFSVVVINTSAEPVTITSLTDDVYGNIATQGTCTTAIGRVLAADPDGSGPREGGTYTCEFRGDFTGRAGDSQTDVVTVVVVDQDGNTATDTDDAVVRLVAAPVKVVPQQIVNRPRPVPQQTLARTGSSSATLATLAGTLLLTGGLLLLASRTMSSPSAAGADGARAATRRRNR